MCVYWNRGLLGNLIMGQHAEASTRMLLKLGYEIKTDYHKNKICIPGSHNPILSFKLNYKTDITVII